MSANQACLHHRHLARRRRRVRRIQGVEQDEPVRADLKGERLALLLAPRQTAVLDAAPVALEPGGPCRRTHPVRHDRGQVVQGGAERLGHQFEQVQVVHGGQHMRAVGALPAARLDQAACLEAIEHPVQQQVLRLSRDEAGAELAEHAEVEARVGQLEPERILPVDPRTHGISGLPVAELLQELEHRDQGEPPRRQTGLAPDGVELAEILIVVERAELVTQPGDDGALGKGSAGDARGLGKDLVDRLRMQAHGSFPPC